MKTTSFHYVQFEPQLPLHHNANSTEGKDNLIKEKETSPSKNIDSEKSADLPENWDESWFANYE